MKTDKENKSKFKDFTEFKCPYCDKIYDNYNGLSKHAVRWVHKVSKEQLLTDFCYNGIRPKCKCGCDKDTPLIHEDGIHFGDFIKGHYANTANHFNYPESSKKSGETRRARFKSGEIVQWNKGKNWNETYDEETQIRLRKGLSLCGERIIDWVIRNDFHHKSHLEEIFEDILQDIKLNLNYKKQFYAKPIKAFYDFYLPDYNILIEVDGDFWHCNPNTKYKEAKYQSQKGNLLNDEKKNKWAKENNYNLLRFWEYDIHNNSDDIIKKLKEILN